MKLDCGISLQQEVGWDRQTIRTTRYLAESQNEPFLVYSEAVLLQQLAVWHKLFPRIQPTHDVTLNGLGRVLETLHEHGVRLDVTCRSQMNILTDLALLTKRDGVMFAAPHKLASHLRAAQVAGLNYMLYSTTEELIKIKKASPSARLLLLLDCQTTPNLVEIKQLLAAGQDSGLPVVGLYLGELASHGPEDLPVLATWLRLARSLFTWAGQILGLQLDRLHLGELADMAAAANLGDSRGPAEVSELLDELFPSHLDIVVSAAATRFLVAPAVTLATRVIALRDKTGPAALGGACNNADGPEMYYYINESVFGAFSSLLLENNNYNSTGGNNFPSVPFPLGGVKNRKGTSGGQRYFGTSIRGPSGDELDIIAEDILLPRLDQDDWLLFPGLGCLNGDGYGHSTYIDGSASTYIYRKGHDDDKELTLPKMGSSMPPPCDGFSVDLDTFQRLAFAADGGRLEIDLKNTFLYEE